MQCTIHMEVFIDKEQNQAPISLHLQADRFHEGFTTHVVSLNS